ncbi:MAG: MFS transporter [Steroidobacteraceae bacterium]
MIASDQAANRQISTAVAALSLAAFGSAISQRVTDPLLPRLAGEFGLTLGTVSWVISCFTLGYTLCQLFFGPVGDRYGKFTVIAWGAVASSLAALLCGLAPGLSLLLLARMVAGGMTAAIIPLAMAWIGDVVPYESRQPVLARFLIGQILGVSAGQLLGGLSADYLGWRTPFFVISILFMSAAIVLFAVRRRLPAHALATGDVQGHPLQHMWREFTLVLQQPWARVVLLATFLEGVVVFGAFAFFAAHLHNTLGVSLTAAGSMVMLFGFGGFLFAAASRQLVQRLGEIGLSYYGAIIMLLSLCSIAWAPGIWLAAPACFAMGLGFYMLHNTLQTNATQMAPQRRGAALAAFAFSYFLGQSSGVALAGSWVERIGTRTIILSAGISVVLVAGWFVRAKRVQLGSEAASE